MGWILKLGDEEVGPLSAAEVRARCELGELAPADLIRREGEGRWHRVADVRLDGSGADEARSVADEDATAGSHDVFVSYSSRDRETADALVQVLERRGLRCWIAPRDIVPGETWSSSIMSGLSGSRAMVLLFSAHSNRSQQVLVEVERAVSRGLPILPFRIDDVEVEPALLLFLGSRQWLDALSNPLEEHLEELVGAVHRLLDSPVRDSTSAGASSSRGGDLSTDPRASGPDRARVRRWLPGVAVALALAVGATLLVEFTRPPVEQASRADDLEADLETYARLRRGGDVEEWLFERGPVRYRAWLRAAEAGEPRAQLLVGILLYDGIGVAMNREAAIEWFQRSADSGDPGGMNALAYAIRYSRIVPKDQDAAVAYYREAVARKDPVAMWALAACHEHGFCGLPVDPLQARELYRESAELGYRESMWSLSKLLKRGSEAFASRPEEAAEWRARAARAGQPNALAADVSERLVAVMEAHARAAVDGGVTDPRTELADALELYDGLGLRAQLEVLGGWHVTASARRMRALAGQTGPMNELLSELTEALIVRYSAANRALRRRMLFRFAAATSNWVAARFDAEDHRAVADFYSDCYEGVGIEYVPGFESQELIKQLRASIVSLYRIARRQEADALAEEALAFCDALLADRPWDWWAKLAYGRMCFAVADVMSSIGLTRVQPLLRRGWEVNMNGAGYGHLLEEFEGRLPLQGEVPEGADDEAAAYFMLYADPGARLEFNETSAVESRGRLIRITIPTDFGGEVAPYDLFVHDGARAFLELQDQIRWVEEYRGGIVPAEVRESFGKLFQLAEKNGVSYSELVKYSLNVANEKRARQKDAQAQPVSGD